MFFLSSLARFAARGFINISLIDSQNLHILEQLILEAFITKGYFLRHIRHMREIYAARRAILVELLQQELGDLVEVQPPQAGLHLVCWFPPEMDDQRISQRAGARGLEVMPLSRLALGSLQRGGLVLGYAHAMRNEFDLGSRTGMRASFMALTFADIAEPRPRTVFMTLFMALSGRLHLTLESGRARDMSWAVAGGTALTELDLASSQQQASALNEKVQPLQLKVQLVAHPVGYGAVNEQEIQAGVHQLAHVLHS